MQNIKMIMSALLIIPMLALAYPAHAGQCFEDPVYERAWSGTITTGAYVRDVACMEGSEILTTLPVGTLINIIGETDGWYQVETPTGLTGWVGQWLIEITSTSGTQDITPEPEPEPEPTTTSSSLTTQLAGQILLQVEEHGEAWYVNPTDNYRYYMKDGATAYEMMRAFGLGISEADYTSLVDYDWALRERLKGRIVLRVEAHGEAYWVHPDDGSLFYLADGPEAYNLMRTQSLGITNADLALIPSAEFEALPY